MAAIRPRPLDQVVLEHERRHALRARQRDPPFELGRVHAGLEQAEGGRDLPLVVAAEHGPDRLHGDGRHVRELRRREHGERRALEQAAQSSR